MCVQALFSENEKNRLRRTVCFVFFLGDHSRCSYLIRMSFWKLCFFKSFCAHLRTFVCFCLTRVGFDCRAILRSSFIKWTSGSQSWGPSRVRRKRNRKSRPERRLSWVPVMISGDRGGQVPHVNAGTSTAALRVLSSVAGMRTCTNQRCMLRF